MTDGPGAIAITIQALMAGGLIVIGTWGRQAAENLPPTYLDLDERAHRAKVMRRGSTACVVVGAVLALSVLWAIAG